MGITRGFIPPRGTLVYVEKGFLHGTGLREISYHFVLI